MFTYNEVQEKLNSSRWPDSAKKALQPILPRLGKWSLSFVYQQLSDTGSEFVADDIAKVISSAPVWYDEIQKSAIHQAFDDVKELSNSEQEHIQRALLAVVMDIRSNKAMAAKVPQNLSRLFDKIEVAYFKDLPSFEVVDFLNKRINSIFEVAELQMEVKRYCYYRDILNREEEEVIAFRKALESNEQLIGTDPKSVKKWIEDFLQAASSSGDHSMYNVAQYITNNAAVKNLTSSEKNIVSDILKLHHWLFQPYVTAEEIESYEKTRMGNKPQPVATSPASAPAPKPLIQKPNVNLPEFDAARATPSPTLNQNKHVPEEPKPEPAPTPAQGPANRTMNVPNQYSTNPAKIHDLINRKPKAGVVMDPTNVKLEEEKRRMSKDREDQTDIIQLKLAELRNRNQTQEKENE